MAWEDEAKRPDTRPIAGVKIGSIRKFADAYLEDDPDNPGPWLERLTTAKGPSREVNLQTHEIVSPEAELELVDGDGEISDLLVETQIQGQETELFSKLRTPRNEVVSKKVFQGPLERREGTGGDTLSCVIRPNRLEKLGIVQTPVTLDRFPSAPANEVGNGCPIVIGLMDTADANWTKGVLPVRAPIVADAGQGAGICLHTGPGGDNAATHVLRDRHGTITNLGNSGGGLWTVNPVAVDAQGRRYIGGTVIAAQFANGDQFYTDEQQGIQQRGYVTLDGVNDYYFCANADLSSNFPGKTAVTSYTFEVLFRTGAAFNATDVFGIWNNTTGQKSCDLYITGAGAMTWYHSKSPGVFVAAGPHALAINTAYWVRISWEAGLPATMQIGAVSHNSAVADDLNASTSRFTVGANGDNGNKLSGRIYYLMAADGAQPLTAGNTRDREQPLEDIISEWRFYSAYGDDYQGTNDLTPVGVAPGDYTHQLIETTPAWIIDKILRWKPYLNVPCNLVNRASFGALAAEQETDAWHTTEYYAGAVPWTDNSPFIKDTGFVLSELLKNQDAVLFENDAGRFTIKSANISETVDEADIAANLTVEDITIEDVTHTRRPFELLNDCRYSLKINNMGAGELWLGAEDTASQTAYSLITKDAKIDLPFIRDLDMAQDIVNRQMLRRAGDAYKIKFTLADIWGAALNPGDIITLTHPNMPGGWNRKQFYVTGVNPDLITGTVDLIAVSIADVYGPISFLYGEGGGAPPIEDKTTILSPTLDTYVYKYNPNTAYGTSIYLALYGWDDAHVMRSSLKFPISTLGAATIKSATLKLYCTRVYQDSGSPDPLKLRELLITTWGNNSTWNHFAADGAGAAWTDGTCIGGVALAPDVSPYGTGWKTFTLNAAGIAYLQAQIAGNAHLTFLGLENEDYNDFASQNHGTTSWRPTLTVVWV